MCHQEHTKLLSSFFVVSAKQPVKQKETHSDLLRIRLWDSYKMCKCM